MINNNYTLAYPVSFSSTKVASVAQLVFQAVTLTSCFSFRMSRYPRCLKCNAFELEKEIKNSTAFGNEKHRGVVSGRVVTAAVCHSKQAIRVGFRRCGFVQGAIRPSIYNDYALADNAV